jgi:hypothetical protein
MPLLRPKHHAIARRRVNNQNKTTTSMSNNRPLASQSRSVTTAKTNMRLRCRLTSAVLDLEYHPSKIFITGTVRSCPVGLHKRHSGLTFHRTCRGRRDRTPTRLTLRPEDGSEIAKGALRGAQPTRRARLPGTTTSKEAREGCHKSCFPRREVAWGRRGWRKPANRRRGRHQGSYSSQPA